MEETRLDWVRLTAVPSSQATASNDFRSKSSNSSARSFCEISAEVEDMFMVKWTSPLLQQATKRDGLADYSSCQKRCCGRSPAVLIILII